MMTADGIEWHAMTAEEMSDLVEELGAIESRPRLAREILSLDPDLQREPRIRVLAERVRGCEDEDCDMLVNSLPSPPIDPDDFPPYVPEVTPEERAKLGDPIDYDAYRERILRTLAAAPDWIKHIPDSAILSAKELSGLLQSEQERTEPAPSAADDPLADVLPDGVDGQSTARLSLQQRQAIASIQAWLQRGEPQVFCLFGYAGTGKTTLALTIADMVDGPVAFVAYTGKAAVTLRSKGCEMATTIHGLIYYASPVPPDDVEFFLKKPKDINASLIILDECSMVDEKLAKDLLSFGIPVLAMGDPHQLPPIKGEDFFTARKPDFALTDVHRQAATSPILRVASGLRNGWLPAYSDIEEMKIIPSYEATSDMYMKADQIIVGRHETAHRINAAMRTLRGFEERYPQVGDRLVCLRSNWKRGLINGSIWEVQQGEETDPQGRLRLTIFPLDDVGHRSRKVRVLRDFFERDPRDISEKRRRESDEFGYAYALTAHKAQGSQWPSVLIVDESDLGHDPTPCRWLYTAITRASQKAVVLRRGWKFRDDNAVVRKSNAPGRVDLAAEKAIVSAWVWMNIFGTPRMVIGLMKDAKRFLQLQEGIHAEAADRIRQACLEMKDRGALQFRDLDDVPTLHAQHLSDEHLAEIRAAWPTVTDSNERTPAKRSWRARPSNGRAARRTGRGRNAPFWLG